MQTHFSIILRKYRKKLHLTQYELADACGLSQSNISAWEKGTRLPLPDGLIALADFFGCSVDALLGRKKVKQNKSLDGTIIDKYSELTEEQKTKVIGYIDCLLEDD